MAIETIEDKLISDFITWAKDVTTLSKSKIVPSSKGDEEQSVPVPDKPFLMITISPINVPIGEQPEFTPAKGGPSSVDQTRTWKMRATIQTQVFGVSTLDVLTALKMNRHRTDMALRVSGSVSDISELSSPDDRSARYALDFEVHYEIEHVTETVPEMQKLKLGSSFASDSHSDDVDQLFTLTL